MPKIGEHGELKGSRRTSKVRSNPDDVKVSTLDDETNRGTRFPGVSGVGKGTVSGTRHKRRSDIQSGPPKLEHDKRKREE